ncbi:hypothetical protein [Myceligenerans indicum]|uniref:hypothetical protein n=1 Tax=Myceligenerans indicum TaxID=2593663 RepID=UPI001FD1E6A0|nr:hypothetical protein [Myceligenerans indicum]
MKRRPSSGAGRRAPAAPRGRADAAAGRVPAFGDDGARRAAGGACRPRRDVVVRFRADADRFRDDVRGDGFFRAAAPPPAPGVFAPRALAPRGFVPPVLAPRGFVLWDFAPWDLAPCVFVPGVFLP